MTSGIRATGDAEIRSLIVTDTVPAIAFYGALYAWLFTETFIGYRYRARAGSRPQDRGSRFGVIAGVFLGVSLAVGVVYAVPATTVRWHRYVLFFAGLALVAAGIALRFYAIRVLGRYFTVTVATRSDQRVVEAGPYRLLRHPSYTGSLITFLGICLALGNWLSFLGFVPVLAGYGYRIRVEEAALLEALGNDYRDYMRRTKRLIPYLV